MDDIKQIDLISQKKQAKHRPILARRTWGWNWTHWGGESTIAAFMTSLVVFWIHNPRRRSPRQVLVPTPSHPSCSIFPLSEPTHSLTAFPTTSCRSSPRYACQPEVLRVTSLCDVAVIDTRSVSSRQVESVAVNSITWTHVTVGVYKGF